ncbi:MAG: hypothetical protein IPI59_15530 [Sphingobacteriales bacterium]|jgi:hypothetical protein|nr:hypothetical protein [Sphingobacteriales bacterium]MBP9141688.1 hypothetical protein [Chitinophagales bacterium]MDA0198483.1 hypothetical protein [Bacteroidota bacterium]MBK6888584.1 hypothetical protein [Sphingobacteriales bacterium]MBK7528908.1 hypothetical protein [Sphingobacteriales bacterium]
MSNKHTIALTHREANQLCHVMDIYREHYTIYATTPDAFIMYMGLYDEVYVQLKRKLIETKPKYNLKLYYHHCAMLRYWYEDALKFLQFNDEAVNFMKRIAQQATDFRKHLPTKPQNDK